MSYSYDADGQVTSADTPNSPNAIPVPVTRSYDSLGNLTMLGDTAQAFSADGSLCWSATVSVAGSGRDCASVPSGATSFLYNANGQRTSAGSKGYAWNAAGELATAGSSSMTLRCDPEGLRVGMITGTGWRRCSWDDTSGVGELMSGDCAGGEMFFFVYGPDGMPCEQLDFNGGATTEVWLHQDATGSVGLSTDSAGNQTWTRSYDPWGNVTATTGKPPQLGCDSEPVDPTGQIYLQARYYDPTTGQFLSSDPAFTATLSSYGYTDNDPLNGSDPTGQNLRQSIHYLANQVGRWTCRIFTGHSSCADTGRINAARHFIGSALTAWIFVGELGPDAGRVASQSVLQYHEFDGCVAGLRGNGPWRVRDAIADQFNNAVGSSVGTSLAVAHVGLNDTLSTLRSLAFALARRHLLDLGGGFSD